MDVVGSEIGQKMRSAIKAKLTELGCYVDDELPDYVMVMVANKRTRAQMEDDLQLFLGDNTELFVNWLHQVLKKLQEVTVAAPTVIIEDENIKEKDKVKEKKPKEKKDKDKTKKSDLKKAKKKEKEKLKTQLKKKEKKSHKKKKSKHDEIHRPNIPPLLMNIEKESEPSITDVFAGQILKNHGIIIDTPKIVAKEVQKETKPDIKEIEEVKEPEIAKRPIVPIIDPATIVSEPTTTTEDILTINDDSEDVDTGTAPREDQLKEINEIEAKIQGLKQKLAEQLDSMSDDEDFLNIRTEAEELMNDFAEDVFQEISEQATGTPPIPSQPKSPIRATTPVPVPKSPIRLPVMVPQPKEPEVLQQIELKLPKRPIRERLGIREEPKKVPEEREKVKEKGEKSKKSESPERFTPEREPELRPPTKSAKSRLGDPPESQRKHSPQKKHSPQRKHSPHRERSPQRKHSPHRKHSPRRKHSPHKKHSPKRKHSPQRKHSHDEKAEKQEAKRLTSKVSVLENRYPRVSCASVVRVRPRPRMPGQASSLLLRAVADAHKSLLTIPPKIESEPTVKRAMVLPMRRCEPQKIMIQVPGNNVTHDDPDAQDAISLGDPESEDSKLESDGEKDEYIPKSITKKFQNTDYIPSTGNRITTKKDDTFIIETINIHNPTVDKDKNTKFIVTMDGYHPNAFLAKKLKTEGLLNDDEDTVETTKMLADTETVQLKEKMQVDSEITNEVATEIVGDDIVDSASSNDKIKDSLDKQNISNTSDESDTQVIIEKAKENPDEIPEKILEIQEKIEKRKSAELLQLQESPPAKKKRSSPIVFDVKKKEKDKERARTESVGSDNHVTVTTTTSSNKYDSLPPLSVAERKPIWCRAFPQCRYGSACAFQHPRCRFAAACTRRGCVYAHSGPAAPVSPVPVVASHVVPSANFKTISATPLPAMCKYYPSCSNPVCHFYHPKPCRYGKTCGNKFDCNFFHADIPSSKWRYPA